MATPDISGIETAVEAMIQEHVAAYEATLREALRRKFSTGAARSSRTRRKKGTSRPSAKPGAPRRSAEELSALGERFLGAVEQSPGETMAVLRGSLGLSSQELERPVLLLKRAGLLKAVGERSRTRYYPMAAPPS